MAQDKGVLDITKDQAVRAFREKNAADGAPINAGYMVLEPQVFDLLDGDSCVFEKTALVELANQGQLMSYVHTGFWQCMDNIREKSLLEKLLEENKLLKARTEALQSAKRVEELYADAIAAMKRYSGNGRSDEDEY